MTRLSKYERKKPLSERQIFDNEDLNPEDDEPQLEIWITNVGWRQLDQLGTGKWYDELKCSLIPTAEFCVQTLVPASAVKGTIFHPDLTEPDTVSEWCEVFDVPVPTPVSEDRINRLLGLTPGHVVICKNVGYGLVSYERSRPVIEIKKNKMFTETFESGFAWTGRDWVFDTGLGLVSMFVFREEVPTGEEIACDEDYK